MKYSFLFIFLFTGLLLSAQSVPKGMTYQAVARDLSGKVVANQDIGIQISLTADETKGKEVFAETHQVTTNALGLFNIVIGEGQNTTGRTSLDEVPWSESEIWMNLAVDMTGGNNYTELSSTRLLTVPYAFHAGSAERLSEGTEKSGPNFYWKNAGNVLTSPGLHFVGTRDFRDLILKTNNIESFRITAAGDIIMTGDVTINGNLAVTESADIGIDLNVGNDATIGNDLSVVNNTDIGVDLTVGNDAAIGNDASIGNDLSVVNNTDIGVDLTVGNDAAIGNDASIGNDLSIVNNTAVGQDLTVGDDATITDDLAVGGDANISGDLGVAGDGSFFNLNVTNNTSTGNDLTVGNSATVGNDLGVTDDVTIGGDLGVTGSSTVGVNSSVGGNETVTGNSSVGMNLSVGGNETVTGNSSVTGTTTSTGQMNANGGLVVTGKSGGAGSTASYPILVTGSNQGIAVQINQSRTGDNHFMTFFDTGGMQGRIEGQTSGEVASTPEYIFETAILTAEVVAAGVNIGLSLLPNGCAGVGVVACPPEPSVVAIAIAEEILAVANLAAYQAFAFANAGVTYQSGAGDYAEWLERDNLAEQFTAGDIVAVAGGKISKETASAAQFMVVSTNPIVLGNMPEEMDKDRYEMVAFMGQVPVKVRGEVKVGDYILPSGLNDGTGISVSPASIQLDQFAQIVGVAWTPSPEGSRVSLINVAVGMNANDIADVVVQQQLKIDELEQRLIALESGKPMNPTATNLQPASPIQEEAITFTTTTTEPVQFDTKMIEEAILLIEAEYRANGIDIERHAGLKKLFNDKQFRQDVILEVQNRYNNTRINMKSIGQ